MHTHKTNPRGPLKLTRPALILLSALGALLSLSSCKEPQRVRLNPPPKPLGGEPVTGGALVGGEGPVAGVTSGGAEPPTGGSPGGIEAGVTPPAPVTPPYQSVSPRLKRLNPQQLTAKLSGALGLPSDALCNELGDFSCLEQVHTVTLGGVDPYQRGIYEAEHKSTLTTTVAVERVVYAACGARVTQDIAGGEGLFAELLGSTTSGALREMDLEVDVT